MTITDTPLTEPVLRSAVRALPPYVAGRRAASELTAALASNESHYEPLPSVVGTVQQAGLTLNRYPDPAATELRTAIAHAVGVDADQIAVGPGSVGVLQQIIGTVCDHGDEVLYAWRSFEAYPILVGLAGAVSVAVPLRMDEGHDLAAMADAITERTRLIILCSPNNPTGVSIGAGELADFLDRVPARVLVVIDEAYIEYATGPDTLDAVALLDVHPNVCVLRTFSKAHGLAGLRVGYAVAQPTLAAGLRSVGLPFAVSTVAQVAAIASLRAGAEMRARVDGVTAERTRIIDAARALGWSVPDSQANFLWLRATGTRQEELAEAFAAADILVRVFRTDGIRVTLAGPAENDRVLAVLRAMTVGSAQ